MLMGLKARAEAGAGGRPSSISDTMWLLGVSLSGVGIVVTALVGGGIPGMLLSGVYAIGWLLVLLIFDPHPKYSLALLLAEVVTWYLL